MHSTRTFCAWTVALALALGGCSPSAEPVSSAAAPAPTALEAPGRFTSLTYNVAGLLEPFSSGSPAASTPIISCRVRPYDLVNVQEDFNYHAALYDTCDDHPYRSATSGGMGIGSGLNTLSRFGYEDFERVRWNACNGVDCLTPKGFTLARVRLAEGVFVDLYNLHAQAQTAEADLTARRENVRQLARFIEYASAGNAVIVMGDTNTRYTRAGDGMRALLERGFTDAWVSLVRGGDVPAVGDALTACPPETSAGCEVVDKVLFRDGGLVGLAPVAYLVDRAGFLDQAGKDLSDHWPVAVTWAIAPPPDRRLSDRIGGPHGDPFQDAALLPATPVVTRLGLRTGSAVDQVELTLSTGAVLSHGGQGGSPSALDLAPGEVLSSVTLCAGKHQGRTRVAFARFTTSAGRALAGGAASSDCATYAAPEGWAIVGFHGRAGDTVSKLGVVYAPRPAGDPPPAARAFALVNRASGQCLDVAGARVEPGTAVQQWSCNGGDWQRWTYDPASGLVRAKSDPRLCLDTGGPFGDDDSVHALLWPCSGNAHQRFTLDEATGALALRADPARVLDGFGTAAGSPVITWTDWGGANQRWDVRE